MREVICISVGQAGVQLGATSWELFCLEHKLDTGGNQLPATTQPNEEFRSYFSEAGDGRYTPRALFVDTDADTIDELRVGHQERLYDAGTILSGQSSTGNSYAKGYLEHTKLS